MCFPENGSVLTSYFNICQLTNYSNCGRLCHNTTKFWLIKKYTQAIIQTSLISFGAIKLEARGCSVSLRHRQLSIQLRTYRTHEEGETCWNQSILEKDFVAAVLVNFQLKTKLINNVSAPCLLNSIICSCLQQDNKKKTNQLSIFLVGVCFTYRLHHCIIQYLTTRPESCFWNTKGCVAMVSAELKTDSDLTNAA